VAAMARRFGGGGHRAAAGFKLVLGSAEGAAFMARYIVGPGEPPAV
jgi:nanoRNase/pAp phosphatase (c-di-AMP/oligoRNAs hydrolase)